MSGVYILWMYQQVYKVLNQLGHHTCQIDICNVIFPHFNKNAGLSAL